VIEAACADYDAEFGDDVAT